LKPPGGKNSLKGFPEFSDKGIKPFIGDPGKGYSYFTFRKTGSLRTAADSNILG
jgi:hypothetical protein